MVSAARERQIWRLTCAAAIMELTGSSASRPLPSYSGPGSKAHRTRFHRWCPQINDWGIPADVSALLLIPERHRRLRTTLVLPPVPHPFVRPFKGMTKSPEEASEHRGSERDSVPPVCDLQKPRGTHRTWEHELRPEVDEQGTVDVAQDVFWPTLTKHDIRAPVIGWAWEQLL